VAAIGWPGRTVTQKPNAESWEISPTVSHSPWRKISFILQKARICVVFRNWHASCNHLGICGRPVEPNLRKEYSMTHQNTFTSKLAAAASAFFISLVLITTTVTTPAPAHANTVYVGEAA
jgi:hypothetical protein